MTEDISKSLTKYGAAFAIVVGLALATAYIEFKSMSKADGEKILSVCSESRDLSLEALTIYRTRTEAVP